MGYEGDEDGDYVVCGDGVGGGCAAREDGVGGGCAASGGDADGGCAACEGGEDGEGDACVVVEAMVRVATATVMVVAVDLMDSLVT